MKFPVGAAVDGLCVTAGECPRDDASYSFSLTDDTIFSVMVKGFPQVRACMARLNFIRQSENISTRGAK